MKTRQILCLMICEGKMKDIGNVIFGIVIALCLIGLVVCTIYLNSGDQRMLDNFCQSKGYDEMSVFGRLNAIRALCL